MAYRYFNLFGKKYRNKYFLQIVLIVFLSKQFMNDFLGLPDLLVLVVTVSTTLYKIALRSYLEELLL